MASNKATVKENVVSAEEDARTRAAKAILEIIDSKGGMKKGADEKTYEAYRSLGQIHVKLDGRSYGFNIMAFDDGVKMDKKQAVQAVSRTEKAAAQALGITVEEFRAKYVNA